MNLSLPTAARPAAAFVALAWTALAFGTAIAPSAAEAASGAYYRAELAAPSTAAKPIVSGTVFDCSGRNCSGGKATSRPAIVCARLVKEVGPVAKFTVNGKELAAEELTRCNGN